MQMHEIITWLDLYFSEHLGDDSKLIESEQSIRGNLSSLIFLVQFSQVVSMKAFSVEMNASKSFTKATSTFTCTS